MSPLLKLNFHFLLRFKALAPSYILNLLGYIRPTNLKNNLSFSAGKEYSEMHV